MPNIVKILRFETILLTLICVGFLGVPLEGGIEELLPPRPCLKRVRIMLETSNLARKYIHIN